MDDVNNDIEQEYPYQPGWLTIIACGLLFGGCTAILALVARSNQRGISFRHIITLSPSEATVFFWVLTALSAGFVLIAFMLVWHRFTFKQRLALTASGILVPNGRWSREERFIAFRDMLELESLSVNGQHFLHIHHAGGKHTLTASMLPSKAAFAEVCALIAAKLQA